MNVQCVKELTMVQLSVGMATGAAYLGSKVAGHYLPRWAKGMVFENIVKRFSDWKTH